MIITPKDLRIGNLFTLVGDPAQPVLTVESLSKTEVNNEHPYFVVGGIPLTEEWLERLGFIKTYQSDYNMSFEHLKQYFIEYKFNLVEKRQAASYRGELIKCEYVHQLQNLYFDLAGQELEVKTLEHAE